MYVHDLTPLPKSFGSTQVVDELLGALSLVGSSQVPVPGHHYEEAGLERAAGAKMSLQEALTKCYDLR